MPGSYKMKLPETSIIILTRNAGNNFNNTLDKVFSQSYKKFEVIIIDSSSSDNTLDIAKKISCEDCKNKSRRIWPW
jgi:glycosyltransferase involved in cell wall biosynthesis